MQNPTAKTMPVCQLHWQKPLFHVEEAIALFFINNGLSGSGHVTIYQCQKAQASTVLNRPLDTKIDEKACLFEKQTFLLRQSFKLNSNIKQQHVSFHLPETLPARIASPIVLYFRFQITINDLTFPLQSAPMQLFNNVIIAFDGFIAKKSHILWQQQKTLNLNPCQKKSIVPIQQNKAILKTILGSHYDAFAFTQDGKSMEWLSDDKKKVLPFIRYFCCASIHQKMIKKALLPPPVIVDLNAIKIDKKNKSVRHTKPLLNKEALRYFRENGNNIMFFIHGFNVPYGDFETYTTLDNTHPIIKKTIDNTPLDSIKPAQHFHHWLVGIEKALNCAAKNNYSQFSRCAFIAWPSATDNIGDYIEAVRKAHDLGVAVGQMICQIKKEYPDMQINIMTHSQGAHLVLAALKALSATHFSFLIHRLFLCAPALANDALYQTPCCKKLVEHSHVIYSKNDNILGPMLTQKILQSLQLNYRTVWQEKPVAELLSGALTRALDLSSLYTIANLLKLPLFLMLTESGLDKSWLLWRKRHCHLEKDSNALPYKKNLATQVSHYQQKKIDKKIFSLIKTRLNKHHTFLDEVLKQMPNGALFWQIKTSLEAIKHPFLCEVLAIFSFIIPAIGEALLGITAISVAECEALYIGHKSYIDKFCTFIAATIFYAPKEIKPVPCMGYSGVDEKTKTLYGPHLKNIETSQWLYAHSAMLHLNEEILKHLYQQNILQQPHLRFGHYNEE